MLGLHKRTKLMKRDKQRSVDFYISMDVIVEILKKLPAKSLMRFQSVSKQWSSIIGSRRDFIESIVNRSLTHPPQKLPLFIFHHSETFSTVISESTEPVELFVPRLCRYQYVRGLICCSSPESPLVTVYNPTTRQLFPLPEIKSSLMQQFVRSYCYFGYDPIMNQYKVLIIMVEKWKQTHLVFTLERGESWRKIQNIDEKEKFSPSFNHICIDGIIYIVANKIIEENQPVKKFLMSFNIRSERFDCVWALETLPRAFLARGTLVNYHGKLGCICWTEEDTSLWIMDNAEKQEWSRIVFSFPKYPLGLFGRDYMEKFSGVTSAGEIFVTSYGYNSDKSFYVYYYNMKQNSFTRVLEIKDTRTDKTNEPIHWIRVSTIHDHVENTMWI